MFNITRTTSIISIVACLILLASAMYHSEKQIDKIEQSKAKTTYYKTQLSHVKEANKQLQAKNETLSNANNNLAQLAQNKAKEIEWRELSGTFKAYHYHDNLITKSGTVPKIGRTIAVDPSVIPLGYLVKVVEKDGTETIYVAEDTGGNIKGNKLDIFCESEEYSYKIGVKYVKVYVKSTER